MQTVNLTATLRSEAGKSAARRMRRNGDVPGILYGPRRPPTPVAFRAKEFREQVRGHESTPLIQLNSEAEELRGRIALLKDAQYDSLSGVITHADFYEVDMAEKIRATVALHFVGKPAGAVHGGILQPICRELEVECLPASIPDFLEVDVTALEIHDSIHVSELKLPDGVAVPFDSDLTLVTIAAPATSDTGAGSAGGEAAAGKS